jgi:diguanylate cyclase (GGDEF)-like protein
MEQNIQIDYLEKSNKKLKKEIQELRRKLKSYKYDDMTGLLRRTDFNDRFDELFHNYDSFGHRFIIAMVDLNGLHEINRLYDMEAGDEFIIRIANILKELFEDSNIFRIGGDEFMILKKGNDIEHFNERLNKIPDSEVFSVTTQDGYKTEAEMFRAVDAGIIAKKKKNSSGRK